LKSFLACDSSGCSITSATGTRLSTRFMECSVPVRRGAAPPSSDVELVSTPSNDAAVSGTESRSLSAGMAAGLLRGCRPASRYAAPGCR
jgi:hypothetical protein